jgi:hypothetical protein
MKEVKESMATLLSLPHTISFTVSSSASHGKKILGLHSDASVKQHVEIF